ncbi:MAG TPA: CHAT domain-containing tetratricopeptide repeat protein [Bacteroidales bacterium]|nr:CHAT domain-containing tetratricopeptide repeat protein [Bacteroidales bacterium]
MLGDESSNTYNYPKAIVHYKNFCKINAQSGLYRNYARESEVLRKMAYIYSMNGDFKNALNALRDAAHVDSAQNNMLNLLDDIRGIGNCYLYMGDYKSGLTELNKCVYICNQYESGLKQTHRLVAANVYLSLGNCYAILSQFDMSDFYLGKAIKVFQSENNKNGLMIALLKLGINKVDQCNYAKGMELIKQSEEMAKQLKLNTSEHLLALGNVCSANGDYENALVYKRNSLIQADSAGNITQLIEGNVSLGDLYTEVGDAKNALHYYNLANAIIEKNQVDKRDASAMIATRKGDYSKSLDFYMGSGATYSKAITLMKIGMSYFEKKNYDSCLYYLAVSDKLISGNTKNDAKALLYTFKAASLIESGVDNHTMSILDSALLVNQNPDNEWKIRYYFGRLYEKDNLTDKAENSYKRAIDIIEEIRGKIHSDELKSSFMDKRIEVYDRLIKLLNKQGKAEEGFNYAEKARNRAFLDMLARQKNNITHSNSDSALAMQDKILRTKLNKLKDKINNYKETGVNNNDTADHTRGMLEEELRLTNNDYENFLAKLRLNNSKFIQLVKPNVANTNSVIAKIGDNTVMLEYWLSSENIYIWSIDKSGVNLATVPLDKTKSELLNNGLFYTSKNSDKTSYYLSELYKLLISPVHHNLKEDCNLIIVPHGLLHFIPFQALVDEKGTFMAAHYFISYAPSASILQETQKNQQVKNNSLLAMALGDLSVNNMTPLPSTISEVKNITPLFQKQVSRFEKECTKDFFTSNAPEFSYIHLATHGIYDSKSPFSSYILFSNTAENDGKLKVSDIFGLRLNASLVTLSACQTGLGDISNSDEFVGLSRAFMYAGTRAIVVSLWSVADYPTSKLMAYFYEYLKSNPANIALTLAQRKLMVDYKAPYYWAPFVLIGSI